MSGMLERYKFGMVMFDDLINPETGWVSVEGDEATRLDSVSSLSNDTIFLTNLPYDKFYPPHGEMYLIAHLRHDSYMVINPSDIAREWGADPKLTDPSQMATLCAQAFARIMRTASALMRRVTGKSEYDIFTGTTMRHDLLPMLPKADFPRGPAAEILRQNVAYVEMTRTTTRVKYGLQQIKLRRPRIEHALDMLTVPVPKGDFEYYLHSQLPPPRELADHPQPVMAQMIVRKMDPHIAPIFAYANTMDKAKRNPRPYVAHPEFSVMTRIADLEVHGAFIGTSYDDIGSHLADIVKGFFDTQPAQMSWAVGIVAETLWRAATLGMQEQEKRSYRPGEQKPYTSWRGLWLRSADKLVMFTRAMRMARAGYAVTSYGPGWVNVVVPPDRTKDLAIDAWKAGLVPPLFMIPTPVPEESFQNIPWGGRDPFKPAALLTFGKKDDLLWNLDRIPTAVKAEREAILKEIAAATGG